MKVLIIEDNKDSMYLLELVVCTILKHDCYKAHSLTIGKCILMNSRPDLILLDWKLGQEGNASEIVDIAKSFYTPEPHVIIISGVDQLENIANELNVDYLCKPFKINSLEEKINKINLMLNQK
jgi:response regulator of citrate/malate metabolism